MATKARKTKKHATTHATTAPAAPAGSPLQTLAEGAAAALFNELIGKVIPNYAASRDVSPDIIAAAGLRNGMTPDEVNAAIHRTIHGK